MEAPEVMVPSESRSKEARSQEEKDLMDRSTKKVKTLDSNNVTYEVMESQVYMEAETTIEGTNSVEEKISYKDMVMQTGDPTVKDWTEWDLTPEDIINMAIEENGLEINEEKVETHPLQPFNPKPIAEVSAEEYSQ